MTVLVNKLKILYYLILHYIILYYIILCYVCRTKWPRNLRHELPQRAQTFGSWVRIPLDEWMSVYSVCVVLCEVNDCQYTFLLN
jgi:hypothetical protein